MAYLDEGYAELAAATHFSFLRGASSPAAMVTRALELGLADLPELPCTPEGAVRLRNGNPGMVLTSSAQYGDEAWASYQGRPVAVGIYKAGELHPSRVFNLD